MSLPLGAIQVTSIAYVFNAVALLSLDLRLWSRRLTRKQLAFDDYMAIQAMILSMAAASCPVPASSVAGLGVHLDELLTMEPEKLSLFLKLFVPGQLLWAAANSSVKFSILSLYTTIFPAKKFQRICHITMGITLLYFISVFLEAFLLCQPVQYTWDKTIEGGSCEGENTAYLVAGITNLVLDALIVALPMPKLFGLQMTLPRKISIVGIFSLGALICVISLLRVMWLYTWDLNDLTYSVTKGAIYSILESTLGVVSACLPVLRPVLRRIFGAGTMRWTNKGSSAGTDTNNMDIARRSKRASWSGLHRGKSQIGSHHDGQHAFLQLDDEVPLTNITGQKETDRSRVHMTGGTGIMITQGWEIDDSNRKRENLGKGNVSRWDPSSL